MITIDGSMGEGGGQVLRSALTLSILTGQALKIEQIRARRSRPGLQAQHLQAVRAAAAVSQAQVEGDEKGSSVLTFQPGAVRPGRYIFDIGTAGSTSLVLQTIFLPLCFAPGKSTVTLLGGTHVPFSPPYHFLEWSWLPLMEQLGCRAELSLIQAGFNPGGGGEVKAVIRPVESLAPLDLTQRGRLLRVQGLSAAANLEAEIPKRQKLQALRRVTEQLRDVKIRDAVIQADSPGTFIVLLAEFEQVRACFSALGEKGKRAERVADEAVDALESHLSGEGAVELHLADQILLPLALAKGQAQFTTSVITSHLLTNAQVIEAFLPVRIHVEGQEGGPGRVRIEPKE
jgi:RNA 3'-phosphate cyclase